MHLKIFAGKKLKKKVILASQNRIFQQSKAILPLMRQLNETNDTASKKKTTASHSRNAQAHNSLCNIPHLTKSVNTEISLELFTTIGHGDYSSVNAINKLIAFLVVFIHKQLSGFHRSYKTQPSTRLVNPRLWLAWIPLIPENGTLGIESITSLEQFTPLQFCMCICIYRHVYVHIYTHTNPTNGCNYLLW